MLRSSNMLLFCINLEESSRQAWHKLQETPRIRIKSPIGANAWSTWNLLLRSGSVSLGKPFADHPAHGHSKRWGRDNITCLLRNICSLLARVSLLNSTGFDGAFAQNGRCQKTNALGPLDFIGAGLIGRDWLGYGRRLPSAAALVSASITTRLLASRASQSGSAEVFRR
jgi:hypothetical protein